MVRFSTSSRRISHAVTQASPRISRSTGESSGHSKSGAIDIEGVFLPSVSFEEDLSRSLLILLGIDIMGDVGADSYLFEDVVVDEGVGVRGLCGIVV